MAESPYYCTSFCQESSRQLRASGKIKIWDKAIERERLLMNIEPELVAAFQENPSGTMEKSNEIQI